MRRTREVQETYPYCRENKHNTSHQGKEIFSTMKKDNLVNKKELKSILNNTKTKSFSENSLMSEKLFVFK